MRISNIPLQRLFIIISTTVTLSVTSLQQTVKNSFSKALNPMDETASYSSSSSSLLLRKLEIFSTAARLFADYKFTTWRCNQLDDENKKNRIWDECHERNAEFLYSKFSGLAALWVKLGQYLSSRADIMPAAYVHSLKRCQDSLPASNFYDICTIIERELGKPLSEIFLYVEEKPLAVASIASVYKAVLKSGRSVVIKVQHDTVREKLLQDLKCLETIGETVKYLDPDFDFSPVVREWAKEVPKELDFINEAQNMRRVAANLAPHYHSEELSINVTLSSPIEPYITRNVLVMDLVDGFKVDDRDLLKKIGVDHEKIIFEITKSYAHQIFVSGFYSGDPHAGNIFVDVHKKEPVLLDFGLTKEISDDVRFNFAKMIVAADENDIHGLLEALEGVGLRLRTDVPFDLELLAKYFFRDAKSTEVAQEENKLRRAEYKEATERKKKTLYIGDKINVVSRNIFGWRSSRMGEVIDIVDNTRLRVRFTNNEEDVFDRDRCELQSSKSPIDSWPDSFIFFERVLGLLRGLTATLDVNQSYLVNMTPFARLALKNHPLSVSKSDGTIRGVDSINLSPLLEQLIIDGDVLGIQVSVVRNGQVIVDLSAGAKDPYHLTGTSSSTLFNCFSVTKAVSATAILMLVDQGVLSLDEVVCKYWPEFGVQGKEHITVSDVLNHKSGLQNAGTEELSHDPFLCTNELAMEELMANSPFDPDSYGKVKYHYLSYGWILSGIVRSVSGQGLQEFVARNIAPKLDVKDSFMIGIPKENSELFNVAAKLVLKKLSSSSRSSSPQPSESTTVEGAKATKRPTGTPNLLLNPTFFNNPRIMQSSIPSANGYFSAVGLTSFYKALTSNRHDGLLSRSVSSFMFKNEDLDELEAEIENEELLQGRVGKFKHGFMLFSAPLDKDIKIFGHSGLGGSIAYVRVDRSGSMEDILAVAITVNRLSTDSFPTLEIIRHIHTALGLETPHAFLEKGTNRNSASLPSTS